VVLEAPEKIAMFYQKTPFKPSPKLLTQNTPEYLFGNWNADVAPTQGLILSDSGTGSTSTFVIKILSGNVPTVDSLFTSVGTANVAGAYNLTNVGILSVSAPANPDTGIYTITVAGSGTSASAADAGQFYIMVPEVGDQLTADLISTGIASAPVASAVAGPDNTGKSLSVSVKLPANTTANPSTLSAIAVYIQGSNLDYDTEFVDIGEIVASGSAGNTYEWQSGQAVGAAAPGSVGSGSVDLINFKFYRLRVATGGSGTGPIIGKMVS
jgi:hypothetical protein